MLSQLQDMEREVTRLRMLKSPLLLTTQQNIAAVQTQIQKLEGSGGTRKAGELEKLKAQLAQLIDEKDEQATKFANSLAVQIQLKDKQLEILQLQLQMTASGQQVDLDTVMTLLQVQTTRPDARDGEGARVAQVSPKSAGGIAQLTPEEQREELVALHQELEALRAQLERNATAVLGANAQQWAGPREAAKAATGRVGELEFERTQLEQERAQIEKQKKAILQQSEEQESQWKDIKKQWADIEKRSVTPTEKEVALMKRKEVHALLKREATSRKLLLTIRRDNPDPYHTLVGHTSDEGNGHVIFRWLLNKYTQLRQLFPRYAKLYEELTKPVTTPLGAFLSQYAGADLYGGTSTPSSIPKHVVPQQSTLQHSQRLLPPPSPIIDRWDLPSFEMTMPHLVSMIIDIFNALGLIRNFSIDVDILAQFLVSISLNYNNNPFHNFYHAFESVHACYVFLTQTIAGDLLTPIDKLGLIVAAVAHDVAHPGINNTFLINSQHPLSQIYAGTSILEHYHLCLMFALLQQPSHNFVGSLNVSEFQTFRVIVSEAVLATDQANLFLLIEKIKDLGDSGFAKGLPDHRQLLVNCILYCADLAYCAKPWQVHRQQFGLSLEEVVEQAQAELEGGLPITPVLELCMDPSNEPELALDFLEVCFLPLFDLVGGRLGGFPKTIEKLVQSNVKTWRALQEDENAPVPPELDYKVVLPTNYSSHAEQMLQLSKVSLPLYNIADTMYVSGNAATINTARRRVSQNLMFPDRRRVDNAISEDSVAPTASAFPAPIGTLPDGRALQRRKSINPRSISSSNIERVPMPPPQPVQPPPS